MSKTSAEDKWGWALLVLIVIAVGLPVTYFYLTVSDFIRWGDKTAAVFGVLLCISVTVGLLTVAVTLYKDLTE